MTHYYNEWEPYAAGWLRSLIRAGEIPAGEVDERSIEDVQAQDVERATQAHFFAGIGGWPLALKLAGWPANLPVWTGSCPCQPFSVAGKAGGVGDKRHVWPSFHRLISERRPPVVFGEQVASEDGRLWLSGVRVDLEKLGYGVGAADLCAAGVGATQIRPRLWWVADANHSGRQGSERLRESDQASEERKAARRQPLRSVGRHWPPGPGDVDSIPLLANGLPGVVGACKGYGNAIVPQVAAEFVMAFREA